MTDYVVQMENISKAYRIEKIVFPALNRFNLKVKKGEFVVMSGPSGCGKTTALNLMGCIDNCDEGKLEVCNELIGDQSDSELALLRRTRIGFIFQTYNLIPVLSITENVAYPLIISRNKHAKEKARHYLEKVGLKDFVNRKPNELSGGQRQRAAVARAFVAEPELILADEPTANLDSKNSQIIIELIRKLQTERQLSVVASSHQQEMAEVSDRIVRMVDGKVIN